LKRLFRFEPEFSEIRLSKTDAGQAWQASAGAMRPALAPFSTDGAALKFQLEPLLS
jgi:hypothetical protein